MTDNRDNNVPPNREGVPPVPPPRDGAPDTAPTPQQPPAPPAGPFAAPGPTGATPTQQYPGTPAPPTAPTQQYPGAPVPPTAPTQQYPGTPAPPTAPTQAYGAPQQPYAQRPEPYGAPQHQPTAAQGWQQQPPVGPPAKKGGLSTGAIIGIAGGGLALLLVIALVIAFVVVPRLGGVPQSGGGGEPAGGGGSAASAGEAVTSFFTALSEGDSATALGFIDSPPTVDTLLTDDVLAASNELAPISDIEVVDNTSDGSGTVDVSYLLGDTPVEATYDVYDFEGDGSWTISGVLGSLSTTQFEGLGVTVNGAEVGDESYDIFPGTYEFATTLENFALSGETVVTLTEPYGYVDTLGIEAGLSEAALQTFRDLVRAAANECVASKNLETGCGLALPGTLDDGSVLTDGTITRTIPADTNASIDSLEPTLSYDNPTLAQASSPGGIDVEAQCSQNGTTGTCTLLFGPIFGSPAIDMAAENPEVIWD